MPMPTTARTIACVQKRRSGDVGQRDRHDLGREDEVGADRAARPSASSSACGSAAPAPSFASWRWASCGTERLVDLLGALVAEIGAAEHQQRRDRPGREEAEQQRGRQQEEELVLQRAAARSADDRQLAVGGEADDVARRHRGVVDHDAGGLGAGLRRLAGHVVERGRRDLGEPATSSSRAISPMLMALAPAAVRSAGYTPAEHERQRGRTGSISGRVAPGAVTCGVSRAEVQLAVAGRRST